MTADEKVDQQKLVFVKESASSTFFPSKWVLYPTDPVFSRWNKYKFAFKQVDEVNRVLFIQVDFFDQLLFRAAYDFSDQKYKVTVDLPPGSHGICFIEAVIAVDSLGSNRIEFKRLEWKNETIMPSKKDFSPEAREQDDTLGYTATAGGTFFTSRFMFIRY